MYSKIEYDYAKRDLLIVAAYREGVPVWRIAEVCNRCTSTIHYVIKCAPRREGRWRAIVARHEGANGASPPDQPMPRQKARPRNHPDFGYQVWTPADQAAEFRRNINAL